MAPRSTQRRTSRQTGRLSRDSLDKQQELPPPTATQQRRARKSRRIARARKDDQAGYDMLDHPEGGDERDLVAPSDVEELEIWKKDREREKEDGSCGSQSTFTRLTEDGLPRNAENRESMDFESTPIPDSPIHSTRSISTSPTVPLDSSQIYSPYDPLTHPHASHMRGRYIFDRPEESFADAEEGEEVEEKRWEALVSSGGSPERYMSTSPPFSAEGEELQEQEEIEKKSSGRGEIEEAEGEGEGGGDGGEDKEGKSREETEGYDGYAGMDGSVMNAEGGEVLPDEYEPPPTEMDTEVDCIAQESIPSRRFTPTLDNVRMDDPQSVEMNMAMNGNSDTPASPIDISNRDDKLPKTTRTFQSQTPLDTSLQLLDSDRTGRLKSDRSISNDQTPLPAEADILTPRASAPAAISPAESASSLDVQTASPLIEAQVGPFNIPRWRSPSRSPIPPLEMDHGSNAAKDIELGLCSPLPDVGEAAGDMNTRLSQSSTITGDLGNDSVPQDSPRSPLTAVDTTVRFVTAPSPKLPTPAPADPALEKFRTSRTFRTRTTLQLQPYTKERQIYEAALRRGGLKKGKRAIARERDISPSEEDDEPEGVDDTPSEADIDPERIVIGNTPPERPRREPKKLVDADYDEYFMQFGESPQEDDPVAEQKLQKIARTRLRAQREEKRRRKEDEKMKREFERVLRDGQHGGDVASNDGSLSPPPPISPIVSRSIKHTPGKPRMYGKKDRAHLSNPKESSRAKSTIHSSALIPPTTPRNGSRQTSERVVHQQASARSDMPLHQRSQGQRIPDEVILPALHVESDSDASIGLGVDYDMVQDEESFFINDLPPAASRPRAEQSDDSDHSSASGESSAIRKDARRRIAGRMMPAFMLKRLEREALDKARKKQDRNARDSRRSVSPPRPGHAVVRRAGTDRNGNDLFDFIRSDGESSESIVPVGRSRSNTPVPLRQRELILISEDSDGASASSQAYEDYTAAQSLARLYDGDFETIVKGNRPLVRRIASAKKRRPNGSKIKDKRKRPALGLIKRATPRKISTPGLRLQQARLDFPVQEKRSASKKDASSRKRKHIKSHVVEGGGQLYDRPAIRLDDHVIFSNADFAFDSPDEDVRSVSVTSQSRKSNRTPRRSSAAQPAPHSAAKSGGRRENVDTGVGKARSWANFDKFPIDFGISPLPSGLYCNQESHIGTGSLKRLEDSISGQLDKVEHPEPVSTYGVELRCDMAPAALTSVLTVIFDGVKAATMSFTNSVSTELPSLDGIVFLEKYISWKGAETNGDLINLRSACSESVAILSRQLDGIVLNGKPGASIRNALLSVRLALLNLAAITTTQQKLIDHTAVTVCGVGLLVQLLGFGFDKAIRPLKKILIGDSDSAQIDDDLTINWITVRHILDIWASVTGRVSEGFLPCMEKALDEHYPSEEMGPIAAERIWFLTFGLCALSQFEYDGRISAVFSPEPRWSLVRRAISLIKISHNEETEERAHPEQLHGRDRYIKTMISRCIRLSAIWKWNFDRSNFSIATKDLGVIFKDRQHRNLPTEPPVDYPDFITHFDMSLTANEDTRQETAFELYLRLVCVAAADIIGSAQSLSEAQQAEKDVQRLIMSIIPVSPVKFNRVLPPTAKQLGQLVNRYSTMIAACYFSPSLLPWLLANSRKWISFAQADFESRQVVIRGLMYLAVACRHHDSPTGLQKAVEALAEILGVLQSEADSYGKPSRPPQAPSKVEIERTMVLVVVCFRHIIQHHSFDPESQLRPVYPDACLLHESWTNRIFAIDLANDTKCGMEVVSTIQAFLDARSAALPALAKQRRNARGHYDESLDEYSFGIDFSEVDLAALGGEAVVEDPVQMQEEQFAKVITTIISPRIYRLLSDMLPLVPDATIADATRTSRQLLIGRLTKCWSDCAAILVIEQNSPEGWTPYVGPFGRESWQRFKNEEGRIQVGLQFMTNVAILDPGCFLSHEETFLDLFFQCIVVDNLTIEHDFVSALFGMQHVFETPLFAQVALVPGVKDGYDRLSFIDQRLVILEAILSRIPSILESQDGSATKSRLYRYINLLVNSMSEHVKASSLFRVIHSQSYREFTTRVAASIIRLAGVYMNTSSIPGLKEFM